MNFSFFLRDIHHSANKGVQKIEEKDNRIAYFCKITRRKYQKKKKGKEK
jgi:hypothetical protein